jgi:hypothetical protein
VGWGMDAVRRVRFDDLHDTGFYTWEFLHALGVNKRARIRAYLCALREQGLSRDPTHRADAGRRANGPTPPEGEIIAPPQASGVRVADR